MSDGVAAYFFCFFSFGPCRQIVQIAVFLKETVVIVLGFARDHGHAGFQTVNAGMKQGVECRAQGLLFGFFLFLSRCRGVECHHIAVYTYKCHIIGIILSVGADTQNYSDKKQQ